MGNTRGTSISLGVIRACDLTNISLLFDVSFFERTIYMEKKCVSVNYTPSCRHGHSINKVYIYTFILLWTVAVVHVFLRYTDGKMCHTNMQYLFKCLTFACYTVLQSLQMIFVCFYTGFILHSVKHWCKDRRYPLNSSTCENTSSWRTQVCTKIKGWSWHKIILQSSSSENVNCSCVKIAPKIDRNSH